MDSSLGRSIFFFSITNGSKIICSHCLDPDLETLATAVRQIPPPLHSRYSHTIGNRTFAFLFENDGHIYFAIADNSATAFSFLDLMRNSHHEELLPVVHRLIASLETLSHPLQLASQDSPAPAMVTTAEAPLLARGGSNEENGRAQGMRIDMRPSGSGPIMKSLSAGDWIEQNGQRLWWWHVKLVIAVDVLLCLVLFGIWLGVCRGFRCVAS